MGKWGLGGCGWVLLFDLYEDDGLLLNALGGRKLSLKEEGGT